MSDRGNEKAADDYTPSAGVGYLLGSLGVFLLSAVLAANTAEEPVVFGTAAALTAVVATYLLIVGAVARGLQVARHKLSADPFAGPVAGPSAGVSTDRTTSVGRAGQEDPGTV